MRKSLWLSYSRPTSNDHAEPGGMEADHESSSEQGAVSAPASVSTSKAVNSGVRYLPT